MLVTRSHGFVYAYGADALLFTAALYSVLRLPSIPPDGTLAKPGLRSVVDGLRFITTSPVLVMSFGIDILAMVLAMPRSLFPRSPPSASTATSARCTPRSRSARWSPGCRAAGSGGSAGRASR